MEVRSREEGLVRRLAPDAPTVTVLFGGEEDGPDVGVVHVEVPPGAGMPEHDHGGSDVILVGLQGSVELSQDGAVLTVGAGDVALVRKQERVALRNRTDLPAQLVVAAAPPVFVAAMRSWPDAVTPCSA